MRKGDVLTIHGNTYRLYWKTALDGKTYCRVKVYPEHGWPYQYRWYFKTKKAAQIHILATE